MASDSRLQIVDPTPDPAATLVDTCVLLDILTDDPSWADWSYQAVADARDVGKLVINPIIYAEVSAGFSTIEDLDDAVPATEFTREPLPYQAGFLASRACIAYRKRGGERSTASWSAACRIRSWIASIARTRT